MFSRGEQMARTVANCLHPTNIVTSDSSGLNDPETTESLRMPNTRSTESFGTRVNAYSSKGRAHRRPQGEHTPKAALRRRLSVAPRRPAAAKRPLLQQHPQRARRVRLQQRRLRRSSLGMVHGPNWRPLRRSIPCRPNRQPWQAPRRSSFQRPKEAR